MLAIPGFRGYQVREQRREADRIVRNYVYGVIQRARDDLMRCLQMLSDSRVTELMDPMSQLVAEVDRVAEKVNRAAYGYAGFFDSVRIDAPQLDQMLTYDSQIMDLARKFADLTSNFKASLSQSKLEDARTVEQSLEDSVSQLEITFDKRKSIIEGVEV
jgi:DNA repair ATPase RecN